MSGISMSAITEAEARLQKQIDAAFSRIDRSDKETREVNEALTNARRTSSSCATRVSTDIEYLRAFIKANTEDISLLKKWREQQRGRSALLATIYGLFGIAVGIIIKAMGFMSAAVPK